MFRKLRYSIQEMLDDGRGIESVKAEVLERVQSDSKLRQEVVSEAIDIACKLTVRIAVHDVRGAICRRADNTNSSRSDVTQSLKNKASGLMEFRLPGGAVLRESTGRQCREAAMFYHKIADTNRVRGNFLMRISDIAGDSVVGEVVSEDDCQRAYKEASHEGSKDSARAA